MTANSGIFSVANSVEPKRFPMHAEDVIGVRPERTGRELCITAVDLYAHLLRMKANHEHLERARERKARKAERLARLRQARAERRLLA